VLAHLFEPQAEVVEPGTIPHDATASGYFSIWENIIFIKLAVCTNRCKQKATQGQRTSFLYTRIRCSPQYQYQQGTILLLGAFFDENPGLNLIQRSSPRPRLALGHLVHVRREAGAELRSGATNQPSAGRTSATMHVWRGNTCACRNSALWHGNHDTVSDLRSFVGELVLLFKRPPRGRRVHRMVRWGYPYSTAIECY